LPQKIENLKPITSQTQRQQLGLKSNLQERTTTRQSQRQQLNQIEIASQDSRQANRQQLGLKSNLQERTTTRQQPRQIQDTFLAQEQTQRQIQRGRTTQQTSRKTTPQRPKITPPFTPPPTDTQPKQSSFESGNVLVRGFNVYVKRKGRWVKISREALPKAEALQLGSERTKKTLAATFKIEEARNLVSPSRLKTFTPNKDIFRSYKIVKGKKVPLTNTFIQKASKRLSNLGEVKEIQRAKKIKWI